LKTAWLEPLCRGSPKYATQTFYKSAKRTCAGLLRILSTILATCATTHGINSDTTWQDEVGGPQSNLDRNKRPRPDNVQAGLLVFLIPVP